MEHLSERIQFRGGRSIKQSEHSLKHVSRSKLARNIALRVFRPCWILGPKLQFMPISLPRHVKMEIIRSVFCSILFQSFLYVRVCPSTGIGINRDPMRTYTKNQMETAHYYAQDRSQIRSISRLLMHPITILPNCFLSKFIYSIRVCIPIKADL